MRQALFELLYNAVRGLAKFAHANGVVSVYDYPISAPIAYPTAYIVSDTVESVIYDTARDLRLYSFLITVIGEKFGDTAGLSQGQALETMRKTEDEILALIDDDNRLGSAGLGVIWTRPMTTKYGYTDGNSRVVLELNVRFEVPANITLGN